MASNDERKMMFSHHDRRALPQVGSLVNDGKREYRVVRQDEVFRIEDGRSFGYRIDDGWGVEVSVVPLTAEEVRERENAKRIAELERRQHVLQLPPDDERDRDALSAEYQRNAEELRMLRGE